MLTAGEFCNRVVTVATPDETVVELAKLMLNDHVGTVVLVEERAEGRAPVGIVTDRDIVMEIARDRPDRLANIPARDVVRPRLVVARESEGLHDALARMRREGVRRLPVIDSQGLLQGILSFDDLLGLLSEELVQLKSLLEHEQAHELERELARTAERERSTSTSLGER